MASSSRKQQIESMLQADPDDPFLRYALAMELAAVSDHAGAAEQFAILIQQRPEYVPAYFQYGRTLIQLGRDQAAAAILRTGMTTARQAGDTHTAEELEGLLASLA